MAPKIDSIYEFTDKALVELKSWLEPWFLAKPETASTGGSGSGIMFDTYPQNGGYLFTETSDDTDITTTDGNLTLSTNAASAPGVHGKILLHTQGEEGDIQLHSDNGFLQLLDDSADGISVQATAGNIEIEAGLLLMLLNLPTADPGVAGAVWNDSGTLKIS